MPDRPIYHFVSHSHWDREWYLPFEEFRARLVEMIDDLMEMMRDDPEFRAFLFDGQMAMVLDYLEVRAGARTEFRAMVEKGRFTIGPWYVLTDEFLPSGESHVRNLLLGMSFARELGEPMKIGYLPDQFGHIAQMPQILSGFGIKTAVLYRGFGGENGEDSSEYRWIAPDGSTVLMLHLPKDGYSFCYFARDTDEEMFLRFERLRTELDARARSRHRLVLNGGDHFWPDRNIARALRLFRERYAAEFTHASLPESVAALRTDLREADLPVITGELRSGLKHAFAVLHGTASSRIGVKMENHACELLLEKTIEPLNALAVMLGHPSRRHLIRRAWMYLLQNQDHDVICGASVDPVYREAKSRFEKIRQIVSQTCTLVLEDIIPRDEAKHGDDETLVIFNLLPMARNDVVECVIEFHLQDIVIGINPDARPTERADPPGGFVCIAPDGDTVPLQVLGSEEQYSIVYAKDAYPVQTRVRSYRLLLDARRLPPFGYRTYGIRRTDRPERYESRVRTGDRWIENDLVRVEVGTDGTLSLHDRVARRIVKRLNLFEDGGDIGDGYTWCPPQKDRIITSESFPAATEILEEGPLRAVIAVSWSLALPARAMKGKTGRDVTDVLVPVTTRVSVTADSRRVDCTTVIRNTAEDHRLRVLFHTDIRENVSFAHGQFAIVGRVHDIHDWREYPYEKPVNLHPMKQGVTIQDAKNGFTLFTRGLPEYDLDPAGSGILALTLLRCVGELSASKLATRPGGDAGWKNTTPDSQCPGTHVFEYALLLHESDDTFDDVLREAQLYDSPPLTVARKHAPPNHREQSFIRFDGRHVVQSACKEAEEGGDMILRAYNPTPAAAGARLHVYLAHGGITPTDLSESSYLEAGQGSGEAYLFHLPPHTVRTVRIRRHG